MNITNRCLLISTISKIFISIKSYLQHISFILTTEKCNYKLYNTKPGTNDTIYSSFRGIFAEIEYKLPKHPSFFLDVTADDNRTYSIWFSLGLMFIKLGLNKQHAFYKAYNN